MLKSQNTVAFFAPINLQPTALKRYKGLIHTTSQTDRNIRVRELT